MNAAYPGIRVTERAPLDPGPCGAGWVEIAALATGGAAGDGFLDWDERQILRDYGAPARPDVTAGFGLHRYLWSACLLFSAPWFLDRRVPRLSVDRVAFHREDGHFDVRVDSFACLPDDPAAHLPGAHVVPNEEALRAELRAAVAEHAEPLLTGLGRRARRGRRALWALVTDDLAESLLYLGTALGEPERARAELALLLPGATAPYVGGHGFRELTAPDGTKVAHRDRVSCCLFYTIRPEDLCVTCPRICDSDRAALLLAAETA
ncbi:(2Fe-2S)-binding protein [Streptomyces sp. BI20]|uniref:(2Fe-2S)-binding protein n=1 Tax=Streptomyces sp. BI20 TaxID=3403460 RepID=UPI003C715C43